MEYYSAIKRNKIGSFVVMRMNLESVIQSEVKQRKINITYRKKNGTDEPICRTGIETQT